MLLWQIDYSQEHNEDFWEVDRANEKEEGENWDGENETDMVLWENS